MTERERLLREALGALVEGCVKLGGVLLITTLIMWCVWVLVYAGVVLPSRAACWIGIGGSWC